MKTSIRRLLMLCAIALACCAATDRAEAYTATLIGTNLNLLDAARNKTSGNMALLYRTNNTDVTRLRIYLPGGSLLRDLPLSLTGLLWGNPAATRVLYHPSDVIYVYYTSNTGTLFEIRSADYGMSWTQSVCPLASAEYYTSFSADMDAQGNAHLLFSDSWSNRMRYVKRLTPTSNPLSPSWSASDIVTHKSPKHYFHGYDIAADSGGNPHVVYSLQYAPSQDVYWSAEMYYLYLSGGTWHDETVATRAPSNLAAAFREPRIAIAGGLPVIATLLRYNVITGSDAGSQLFFTRRAAPNIWPSTLVAEQNDNYNGTDGARFTGWNPDLAADNAGRPHISFSDLASWHVGGYQTSVVGQVRYAVESGGTWVKSVPYRQNAQLSQSLTRSIVLPDSSGQNTCFFGATWHDKGIVFIQPPPPPTPTPDPQAFGWEMFVHAKRKPTPTPPPSPTPTPTVSPTPTATLSPTPTATPPAPTPTATLSPTPTATPPAR